MKNISLAITILFSISLISCQRNNPVDQSSQPAAQSNLEISFLMKDAPPEVAKIVGVLSRPGYDTLRSVFTISKDTASCQFNDLAVGVWHLRVNAFDTGNSLRYFGESDVEVYSGITTPVNLELDPTTGSISVRVTWGKLKSDSRLALLFKGAGGSVAIPPSTLYHLQELTLEMFVQINTADSIMVPLFCETNLNQWSEADGFGVKWEEGNLVFRVAVLSNSADAVGKPYSFKRGEWVHVACTYDHHALRIYVNGKIFAEKPYENNIYYGNNGFSFGAAYHSHFGGQHFLRGMMDEVRIWSYARTPEQIQRTMRQSLSGYESGLVGYWNCEQDTASTVLYDKTDFKHNGAISGDVSFILSNAFSQAP
jgi:hypothetical protein